MSTADLSVPLRNAIMANGSITALLPVYKGSRPVFTRIPVPTDAPYPLIVISPDINVFNEDGLFDYRPIPTRMITAFARNDTPAHHDIAVQVSYLVRTQFHRKRKSIVVPGWSVVAIEAQGPEPVATDDQIEGRAISLAIKLAQLRS